MDKDSNLKPGGLEAMHRRHLDDREEDHLEALKHWRSWGSWFSWGSPVGFGLFLVSIGVFLVLLHIAGIIR